MRRHKPQGRAVDQRVTLSPTLEEAVLSASREQSGRHRRLRPVLGPDAIIGVARLDGLAYVNAILDCADCECVGLKVSQRKRRTRSRFGA